MSDRETAPGSDLAPQARDDDADDQLPGRTGGPTAGRATDGAIDPGAEGDPAGRQAVVTRMTGSGDILRATGPEDTAVPSPNGAGPADGEAVPTGDGDTGSP